MKTKPEGTETVIKKIPIVLLSAAFAYGFPFVVVKRYGAWLEDSKSFRLRRIDVKGNAMVDRSEILRLAGIPARRRLWSVDLRAAERRLRENPFVRDVRVVRHFPDRLAVEVEERKPLALLNANGTFYALDRESVLLPAAPGKCYTLPILSCPVPQRLAYGRTVRHPDIERGMQFLLALLADRPVVIAGISELRPAGPDGLILYTAQGGIPVWMGTDGYAWKIRTLEALFQEMEQDRSLAGASYIDLRFEGRVFVGMGA